MKRSTHEPMVVPASIWAQLTKEERESGTFVLLEPLPPAPSNKPVIWVNRAARRAAERKRR